MGATRQRNVCPFVAQRNFNGIIISNLTLLGQKDFPQHPAFRMRAPLYLRKFRLIEETFILFSKPLPKNNVSYGTEKTHFGKVFHCMIPASGSDRCFLKWNVVHWPPSSGR